MCVVVRVCVCACHVGVQYYYANYLFDISIEITMHLARGSKAVLKIMKTKSELNGLLLDFI